MNAHELNEKLLAAADDVRGSLDELDRAARAYAKAEQDYRRAKALAYLASTGTVAEREARAENAINESRYARDLAEGLRLSGLEAVRSHRGILSALQTLANVFREEAAFDRTGPEGMG